MPAFGELAATGLAGKPTLERVRRGGEMTLIERLPSVLEGDPTGQTGCQRPGRHGIAVGLCHAGTMFIRG